MDGGEWGERGECGKDRVCGDVGVLSTSIGSMGGSIVPVGGKGGSVFMDAEVELELVANAASREDGVNFRNLDPYALRDSKSAVCV